MRAWGANIMTLTVEFVGLAGMTLILLAWVPETMKALREGAGAPKEFDALYAAGSLVLVWYSLQIESLVFAALNSLAFFAAVLGLYTKLFGKFPKKEPGGKGLGKRIK